MKTGQESRPLSATKCARFQNDKVSAVAFKHALKQTPYERQMQISDGSDCVRIEVYGKRGIGKIGVRCKNCVSANNSLLRVKSQTKTIARIFTPFPEFDVNKYLHLSINSSVCICRCMPCRKNVTYRKMATP